MELSLFDLHCDTPYEMFRTGQALSVNQLAISLQKAQFFHCYKQVMAFWCPKHLSDEEGWQHFEAMYRNFLSDPAFAKGQAQILHTDPVKDPENRLFIFALEDLRILAGDIDRIDRLFECGIWIVTPLWANESCIGGAHNTDKGLTHFGKSALTHALNRGMLLDISHASVRSAEEIIALSRKFERPVLATHSNAYSVCPASRNLRDSQILDVIRSKGLIGINLHKPFLRSDIKPTVEDLFAHIDYFLSMGATDNLCFGADLDGCDPLEECSTIDMFSNLAEQMLQKNYPEQLIKAIFFENADRFAKTYLSS